MCQGNNFLAKNFKRKKHTKIILNTIRAQKIYSTKKIYKFIFKYMIFQKKKKKMSKWFTQPFKITLKRTKQVFDVYNVYSSNDRNQVSNCKCLFQKILSIKTELNFSPLNEVEMLEYNKSLV